MRNVALCILTLFLPLCTAFSNSSVEGLGDLNDPCVPGSCSVGLTCEDGVCRISYTDGIPYILLSSSFVSVMFCFLFIHLYKSFPALRAWPGPLLFWRNVCDLIFASNILIMEADMILDKFDTVGKRSCQASAFVLQFSLLGSLLWFFLFSWNYWRSVSNPFQSAKGRMFWFHLFVWIPASITAALVAINGHYRPLLHLCWTQTTYKNGEVNYANWVLVTVWIIIAWGTSVIILISASLKLRNGGLERTLATRKASLRKSRLNVGVFTAFWGLSGVFFLCIYQYDDDLNEFQIASHAFSGLFPLLGTVNFIVFAAMHITPELMRDQWLRQKGKWQRETTRVVPEISSHLREEFVRSTTLGVYKSLVLERGRVSEMPHVRPASYMFSQTEDGPSVASEGSLQLQGARRLDRSQTEERHFEETGTYSEIILSQRRNTSYCPSIFRCLSLARLQNVKFRTYCPKTFAYLRTHVYGLQPNAFKATVAAGVKKVKSMTKNFTEAGRSGSFFYFTADNTLMIKTLEREEHSFMLSILDDYVTHMDMHRPPTPNHRQDFSHTRTRQSANTSATEAPEWKGTQAADRKDKEIKQYPEPIRASDGHLHGTSFTDSFQKKQARRVSDSLIVRVYGLYSIRMYGHTQYFCIMQNLLCTPRGLKINAKYDLKGSWINRHAKSPDPKKGVLKDNDFNEKINVHQETGETLFLQALHDCRFFVKHEIMDYSLLLGIHFCKEAIDEGPTHCTGVQSQESPDNDGGRRSRRSKSPRGSNNMAEQKSTFDRKHQGGARGRSRSETLAIGLSNSFDESTASEKQDQSSTLSPSTSSSTSSASTATEEAKKRLVKSVSTPPSTSAQSQRGRSPSARARSTSLKIEKKQSTAKSMLDFLLHGYFNNDESYNPLQDEETVAADSIQDEYFLMTNGQLSVDEEYQVNPSSTLHLSDLADISEFLDSPSTQQSASVLSGINPNAPIQQRFFGGTRVAHVEGPGIYYMGMIDILQRYNAQKKGEHWLKRLFLCQDKNGISCIPPIPYAQRFLQMLASTLNISLCRLSLVDNLRQTTVVDHEKKNVIKMGVKIISVRGVFNDETQSESYEYLVQLKFDFIVIERWESEFDIVRLDCSHLIGQFQREYDAGILAQKTTSCFSCCNVCNCLHGIENEDTSTGFNLIHRALRNAGLLDNPSPENHYQKKILTLNEEDEKAVGSV